MLDFSPVHNRELRLAAWAEREQIDREALVDATNAMIDHMSALVQDIIDDDVNFLPLDPDAEDTFADSADDVHIAWTLGHVIAHVTASSEETCAHAATLARGIEPNGRNRYEVPWETMRTVADVQHRLQESRRIRLAYLNAWPEEPHYETTFTPYRGPQNCITRVLAGLFHDDCHLEQIEDIVRQAQAARVIA